ncbi:hypothetical protein RF11_13900 [Thelohanellus kitauei]|uniref:Uncharacterized protein n=1 Tax=Thelohanellus kitauei TaxID=669202 RepID=A0A0C2IVP7_THEKT|nr:hypothetical protein RF11_13900 [Thelohanellus kitauei]
MSYSLVVGFVAYILVTKYNPDKFNDDRLGNSSILSDMDCNTVVELATIMHNDPSVSQYLYEPYLKNFNSWNFNYLDFGNTFSPDNESGYQTFSAHHPLIMPRGNGGVNQNPYDYIDCFNTQNNELIDESDINNYYMTDDPNYEYLN